MAGKREGTFQQGANQCTLKHHPLPDGARVDSSAERPAAREGSMILGICPTVDFAFKKTFGDQANSVALISLLNAILELVHPITSVVIENPFNYQDFAEDKPSILDVKATDTQGAIFHIEMQVSATA
ncbi:MAG: hypothetical protein DWH82_06625, partial [Planctomycetota bacterium]